MSWWASHGLKTWAWQRLSAVYLGVYLIVFVILLTVQEPYHYAGWYALFSHPLMNIATEGFFLALCIHAWVGIRDLIFDYVKPYGLSVILLSTVIILLIAMFLWSLRIVFLARG